MREQRVRAEVTRPAVSAACICGIVASATSNIGRDCGACAAVVEAAAASENAAPKVKARQRAQRYREIITTKWCPRTRARKRPLRLHGDRFFRFFFLPLPAQQPRGHECEDDSNGQRLEESVRDVHERILACQAPLNSSISFVSAAICASGSPAFFALAIADAAYLSLKSGMNLK